MSQNKGVTVHTPTAGGRERHLEGCEIRVIDGHLHVLDSLGNSIAIYAPGRWYNAVYSEGNQE